MKRLSPVRVRTRQTSLRRPEQRDDLEDLDPVLLFIVPLLLLLCFMLISALGLAI
jgi:hypothetical protein